MNTQNSPLGMIGLPEIIQALWMTLVTACLGFLMPIFNSGNIPTLDELHKFLPTLGYVFCAFILGHIGINSNGELLKKEPVNATLNIPAQEAKVIEVKPLPEGKIVTSPPKVGSDIAHPISETPTIIPFLDRPTPEV